MPHHVNALRVDAGRMAQQLNGAYGIVHSFEVIVQSTARKRGGLCAVNVGALVVAQRGDACGGEAVGKVAKEMVRTERLVAVVRTAAVYKHYGGCGPLCACPLRQHQSAGQLHLTILHGHIMHIAGRGRCVFLCRRCFSRIIYMVRRFATCGRSGGWWGGREEEAGDTPFGIEGDGHDQRSALKFQAFLANGIGRLVFLLPVRSALQCACLHR